MQSIRAELGSIELRSRRLEENELPAAEGRVEAVTADGVGLSH
ncbi:hypothetical protein [Cellulomonas massiliensis]|nr:hypothetical protein [Cellulomonas massiliensis]